MMLRVRTDDVDGEIGSPILLSCCKLLRFQHMIGKFKVKLEGKSGKTISIGCRFPSKFVKSLTLVVMVHQGC